MKNRVNAFLWFALVVTLLLSMSGFILRTSNERLNKTVVTTADYQLFEKSAQASNVPMDKVLTKLKASGVKTIAMKETTLRGLAARGAVSISSYADFISFAQTYRPDIWSRAGQAIGNTYISPADLVVLANQPESAQFLRERLGDRFSPRQIVNFQAAGHEYFIINAELGQLDKSKNAVKELDTQLGFEDSILDKLRSMGFAIILRPGDSGGPNTAYLKEYEPLIRNYNVKTLIFNNNQVTGSPDHLNVMKRLVDKYGLTIGVIETSQQLGIISQTGLTEVIAATGYPINRVYSTSNDDFVTSVDERYYRWVRAKIDRGIRILYVVPFKDDKKEMSENMNDTIATVARFLPTIAAKGFIVDQSAVPGLNGSMPGMGHRLAVSLSLLAAFLLYLQYLWQPHRKWMESLAILGLLACLTVNLLLGMDFSKIYALVAAILYPVFSSLLLLLYLKSHPHHNFIKQLLNSLAIILVINGMGMYTIAGSLADIRYIMNINYFSGVKLAFIVPLLIFPLNYLSAALPRKEWLPYLRSWLQKSPSYLMLGFLLLALAAIYIYIGRSGNDSGIQVSGLEIRMREILENIFLARPRLKEFLIGYPSIMAMIYLYQRYKNDLLLLVFGFGVMIGSISMVNSFCHDFTAVSISISRTLAGLLTGLLIGSLILICIWLGVKIRAKYQEV